MPFYVYQAICAEQSCDYCANSFELMQKMQETPLTTCPQCRNSVHRVIQVSLVKMGDKHILSDSNLKKNGFTKLVNEGDKKFRKI